MKVLLIVFGLAALAAAKLKCKLIVYSNLITHQHEIFVNWTHQIGEWLQSKKCIKKRALKRAVLKKCDSNSYMLKL